MTAFTNYTRPINYGFKPPVIDEKDFWLGSGLLGSVDLNPSGDWRTYLPVFEKQNFGFEPNACVSFGTLSALEMLCKFSYYYDFDIEPNYSDRFLAKLSGTDPTGGNTPKKVADTLRHNGCIPEIEWPYDNSSLENYYKEIPQKLITMGAEWLNDFVFGYEYVSKDKIKDALKRSPIGCAVNAWSQNAKGEYIKLGSPNHWCVLVAFDDFDRPVIFDSYESSLKTLEKGYELEYPQMYKLTKKDPAIEYKKTGNWWGSQIWNNFFRLFRWENIKVLLAPKI